MAVAYRVVGVSTSGYYDWGSRPVSARQAADQALGEMIREWRGPVLADRLSEFMRLFLPPDTSPGPDAVQQLRGLYYDMAGTPFPRQVPTLLSLVGADRLLFGSDYCWTPPPVADAHIGAVDAAESPVGGTTWRFLTTANARCLFPEAP